MGDALDREAALRARVAKLEEALDEIARLSPSARARRTAEPASQGHAPMSERLTPWWVAEGLGKYAMTDELIALRAENERAYNYAENLLRSFVSQHFPPNPDWRPLPDLLGVLTQLDNASTITRDLRAENERLLEALEFLMKTKWKSVDKDNMEFEGRITYSQLERARAALSPALEGPGDWFVLTSNVRSLPAWRIWRRRWRKRNLRCCMATRKNFRKH